MTADVQVDSSFVTTDDVALIFLKDIRDTDTAVDNLNRKRNELKIADIISGDRLTYLGYGEINPIPKIQQ